MIVGGGPAGLAAARGYREAGGGRVTLLTAEPYPPTGGRRSPRSTCAERRPGRITHRERRLVRGEQRRAQAHHRRRRARQRAPDRHNRRGRGAFATSLRAGHGVRAGPAAGPGRRPPSPDDADGRELDPPAGPRRRRRQGRRRRERLHRLRGGGVAGDARRRGDPRQPRSGRPSGGGSATRSGNASPAGCGASALSCALASDRRRRTHGRRPRREPR